MRAKGISLLMNIYKEHFGEFTCQVLRQFTSTVHIIMVYSSTVLRNKLLVYGFLHKGRESNNRTEQNNICIDLIGLDHHHTYTFTYIYT